MKNNNVTFLSIEALAKKYGRIRNKRRKDGYVETSITLPLFIDIYGDDKFVPIQSLLRDSDKERIVINE